MFVHELVTYRADIHDGWANTGLEHTKQETQDEHAGIVFCRDVTDQQDGPNEDHASSVFCNWETLDKKVGRDSPEEISKVKDCCHPAVSLAFEA